MRKTTVAVLAASLVALGAVRLGAGANPFTAEGQRFEPIPAGHVPGKDNGVDSGHSAGNQFHYAGEDCGICHTNGGKAGNHVFTMSGTIYKDRLGRVPLPGAEIVLKDAAGGVVSMTSNEAGNFFTYAPIASDPAGWDATKTAAENQANPGTWRYKAWVRYGDKVTPMVTIAPVGGVSVPRMSCGMHHAPSGSRGALHVGFDTLPAYPAAGLSFKRHVLPILRNKCKACHMPAAAKPTTTYPAGVTFDYSGGLDLSAYSKDAGSLKGIAEVVNVSDPDASPLLTKTITGAQHAGGAFFHGTESDYRALRQWIAEGALNN